VLIENGARFREQVADFLEEGAIRRAVVVRARVGAVPVVDLFLQCLALRQQFLVARAQFGHQVRQGLPEICRRDAGSRADIVFQQRRQLRGDLQAGPLHSFCHCAPLLDQ
jgi:hypothetical protein